MMADVPPRVDAPRPGRSSESGATLWVQGRASTRGGAPGAVRARGRAEEGDDGREHAVLAARRPQGQSATGPDPHRSPAVRRVRRLRRRPHRVGEHVPLSHRAGGAVRERLPALRSGAHRRRVRDPRPDRRAPGADARAPAVAAERRPVPGATRVPGTRRPDPGLRPGELGTARRHGPGAHRRPSAEPVRAPGRRRGRRAGARRPARMQRCS